MFETYDKTQNAYVEHVGEYYDKDQGAWVEVPSAMTYDTTEKAWVERLYHGYFNLVHNSTSPILATDDDFRVSPKEIVLFTAKKSERRFLEFEIPFKYALGDTIEFDLTKNGITEVYLGRAFYYGGGASVSGYYGSFTEVYDNHVSITVNDIVPDEYEGNQVTSSRLYFQIRVSAEVGGNDSGYASIKNLKINGKKYGFVQ